MITQSETIGKIVESLTKAQLEFEPIIKDVKSLHGKFAPFHSCINATRKALCENGLCITQSINIVDNIKTIIETTLCHISGEFFKSYTDLSQLLINGKGSNPLHTWGSIITYTKRYAYLAIIGASSEDEDNDGADIEIRKNDSNKNKTNALPVKNQAPMLSPPDPLITQLSNLIKASGCDIAQFTKFHNISSRDLIHVKQSIDNFDELLITFRESERISISKIKFDDKVE